MRRRLSGKRILITGASSGIGRALAIEAARAGMRLILCGPEHDPLISVLEPLRRSGAVAVAVTADLTSPEDRRAMFAAAIAAFGGLDVLVNNAGIDAYGQFVDLPPE